MGLFPLSGSSPRGLVPLKREPEESDVLDSLWAPLTLDPVPPALCVCAYVGVYSYKHKGCQQLHTVYVAGDGVQAENPSENQGVGPQGIWKMQFN